MSDLTGSERAQFGLQVLNSLDNYGFGKAAAAGEPLEKSGTEEIRNLAISAIKDALTVSEPAKPADTIG